MIALAFLAMATPASVLEFPESSAKEVSIQVIAKTPKLTDRTVSALDLMVDEIPRTVGGFSRRDILDTTNGNSVRCVLGPDYVRIYFSVPAQNLKAGLSLMEALLHNSALEPAEKTSMKRVSAWDAALRPYGPSGPVRQADAQALYQWMFRAENITLAVGGAIEAGQGASAWQTLVDQWPAVRIRPSENLGGDPKLYMKNPGGLATVELTGPVFGASDAALPTRALALFALGSGKGASLFRIVRQNLGFSYRQEALLYPVADGWQPRLLMVMRPVDDLLARGEAARKALLADVSGWTDADLNRALGMADAVLTRGIDFSPFAFGPSGVADTGLDTRTFQSAYWQIKTGQPWNGAAFLNQMRQVQLKDLREIATRMLTDSVVRVLPG